VALHNLDGAAVAAAPVLQGGEDWARCRARARLRRMRRRVGRKARGWGRRGWRRRIVRCVLRCWRRSLGRWGGRWRRDRMRVRRRGAGGGAAVRGELRGERLVVGGHHAGHVARVLLWRQQCGGGGQAHARGRRAAQRWGGRRGRAGAREVQRGVHWRTRRGCLAEVGCLECVGHRGRGVGEPRRGRCVRRGHAAWPARGLASLLRGSAAAVGLSGCVREGWWVRAAAGELCGPGGGLLKAVPLPRYTSASIALRNDLGGIVGLQRGHRRRLELPSDAVAVKGEIWRGMRAELRPAAGV
jgi:hypothetical protein